VEYVTLHVLQMVCILLTLGGPIFVLAFLLPAACRVHAVAHVVPWIMALEECVARWVTRGALVGAVATLADYFVQVADAEGVTIVTGASLGAVWRFVTMTVVGRLGAGRMIALLCAALVMRVPGRARWGLGALCGVSAVLCTALVSHAGAQPHGRGLAVGIQGVHILAAATWIGVLMHLCLARRVVTGTPPEAVSVLVAVTQRFSPVALVAAALLGLSGVMAATRFLGTPGHLVVSAYGLTLLVKLGLLVPLLAAGYVNFRVMRPALGRLSRDESSEALKEAARRWTLGRFARTLELETTMGVLVVAVATILGAVSPPRQGDLVSLTSRQRDALLTPHIPVSQLIDPASFYGAPQRTLPDLRYSEFTHNCSGLLVMLLGLCWLAQSAGGRVATVAGRVWPVLLLSLAVFIAVAADPELWILRRISVSDALRDPLIAEHQIGAVLVLLLMTVGWREVRRSEVERSLAYVLPGIAIFGSLLLLGHAHAKLDAAQELTNLINVQHAVMGGLGLFAGTARWIGVRGLVPQPLARGVWPIGIILVGAFMAFFYREVV
jgi:putative copper resistance protein D